jgi:hypothetical protein
MNQAASTSRMSRFEAEVMTSEKNLATLADLSGRWIERAHLGVPARCWCSTSTAA